MHQSQMIARGTMILPSYSPKRSRLADLVYSPAVTHFKISRINYNNVRVSMKSAGTTMNLHLEEDPINTSARY